MVVCEVLDVYVLSVQPDAETEKFLAVRYGQISNSWWVQHVLKRSESVQSKSMIMYRKNDVITHMRIFE